MFLQEERPLKVTSCRWRSIDFSSEDPDGSVYKHNNLVIVIECSLVFFNFITNRNFVHLHGNCSWESKRVLMEIKSLMKTAILKSVPFVLLPVK